MQSCNTIGNGQLKRSHPSCPGRRLAHFHMRLVPFFHAIRHRALQCHIYIYFFYKALAGGLLFGSGFWVTRCGLEGFCTIWGGFRMCLTQWWWGGVRICISRPCLKKPPWPPARAFQKNIKWDEKNMTSAVRIRICIRKRKKGPNKNLQKMRRGGQKCRAKTFIGTSKCAGSTQFVEFCRLVQFWVKTDILKANCDHFVPRSFLVRRNASGLKVWGFGTHGCRGTGTWGSQSFGTWGRKCNE
jgi:hypothetical protein